jgi:hypothetical protein
MEDTSTRSSEQQNKSDILAGIHLSGNATSELNNDSI